MQVNVEDLSSVSKRLEIEVPAEVVGRELDTAYRDLNKKAKVKGFRPGKTPRNVLERLYGKDTIGEVTAKLIQDSLTEAVREKALPMVGDPEIEKPLPMVAPGSPFKFQVTLDVRPELPDIDFSGLELTKTIYPITDQEMDIQLKMLQKKVAERKPLEEERPLRKGDYAGIDYEGLQNGKPFEAVGANEGYTLKVGDKSILPEFDDEITGMLPGETRNFTLAFPEDYRNAQLAGQTVDFKVTLKEIRMEVLPEFNDEFAKNFGPFETLEALKDAIGANLKQGYDKRSEQELNEQVFSALLEKTEFEVPETFVVAELGMLFEETRRKFAYSNMKMEDLGITPETFAEKYRGVALQQARRQMLLAKVIEQERLQVEPSAVEREMARIATSAGIRIDELRGHYAENPERRQVLEHTLLEKRAMDLIISQSKVTEKQAELEEAPAGDSAPSTEAAEA